MDGIFSKSKLIIEIDLNALVNFQVFMLISFASSVCRTMISFGGGGNPVTVYRDISYQTENDHLHVV